MRITKVARNTETGAPRFAVLTMRHRGNVVKAIFLGPIVVIVKIR